MITCSCHLLTEEHEVDLVQGDVLKGVVLLHSGEDRGLGLVDVAPVWQRGGGGGGGGDRFVADLSELLHGAGHGTQVPASVRAGGLEGPAIRLVCFYGYARKSLPICVFVFSLRR